jgi:hypothetical protein
MASGGSAARVIQVLVVLAILGAIGTWSIVSYAQFCIQRGARWAGVSFSDGISLVFSCEPQSGIRSARFHLWPWKKIELEKINPGA